MSIMKDLFIVIDMQNDFIDGSLGTAEAVSIVPAVVRKIESFDGIVIFTRDTHTTGYLQTAEGQYLPVEHCIKGTKGWEIQNQIEDLRKQLGAVVFDKITFGSKELAVYLADNLKNFGGIRSITLCGLCTDICVISNALLIKAYLPEIPLIVDSECCAGVTPQSHLNALNAMKICQIEII